ncbi:cobalamin-5'-phosphate synthase [Methanocella conradii HZ254]|uniref:Adenosylcobinamide-GDP ribazoletransferase n=1 Tax=Methanocella conradii (strain DSM 24694 / JCM 17849 / CGMCC 1.5162 / HZ254) TaxID=1041930 RepID=H8I720_METCZ|nr:adenosylcobinamide-GDP ribazoletransferase [Methanocella conradii]AFC99850.1 cobalamin-5'-phosphate synthase [Methanocella conradii HZ254]MDI6896433.1 adenosylcobinamide-GDP ribazoletransferase [Methanocella conradii]
MDVQQLLTGIRSGFGFLTTVPVNSDEKGFEAFMGNIYLFIIVGALIGAILGVVGIILLWLLPHALVPVLVLACIYLLTGINHIDGLSDFGDGIVASGTAEKKIAAMKDAHAGAGGILFIGMDLLFLYATISLFAGFGGLYLPIGLLIAETCAKVCIATVAAFGASLHQGMGSMLIERTRKEHYLAGLAIAIVICVGAMGLLAFQPFMWRKALMLPLAGFLAVALSVALGLLIVDAATKNFGGVNGDVMGAANEIGRIASMLALGALLWTFL